MRKILKLFRNIIVLALAALAIFILLNLNKKKVLVIGHDDSIGNAYYKIASEYNYELHIYKNGIENIDFTRELIENADGIIFAGGKDFDPSLYGSSAYDLVEDYSSQEDRDDLELLRLAIEYNKPILGICRGMQLINIYYGGSLYEDLPTQFGRGISHRKGKSSFAYHNVTFNENSRLYESLGGQEQWLVNSMHHEGIKKLADGLNATATSDDGLIEAIENPYYSSYMMALQWHPEYSGDDIDQLTKIIFDDYTKALN